ncbi:MAG: 16S rRNA (adenine(1518)-N(6)/adenine(1519)-N(6))-dimethyltransferase RsmA [Gammaproteobacteria bacterium]|jgi:16S rRNA (adenine1518-N6/adenine1519-N6)-dimethyltransferase|nr:16S rRNA (adenine(1518)-N(6)/adenine(1519)-N(6))-dimethyltransferase RsmA [Gammaproteobacteria bacterium]MBT4462447.1 16S rRNA (adenine(1518)-N(6)/adenine(1519)-N(6))-dimethyltransferase RsmA [Gammaproteobacteria bacterium]MBT4655049.1 16S rRNA (adenine(1518)-N(6)/adenine(1519)-N(6))-dimethyltransferase RsmA [Gammaproteobacteria bacterium]MBT5116682.1 16S rRNA (adenine(1518)-N(6)/adenine(1519)-N(6))-dimethyltransferase RsmA [Gammaproteobacteria bacterium]MBT5762189.1 16S rRNA (adenine(1518)-
MRKHKKRLGQNFLHDKNVINKIINSFELNKDDLFLEIGPGEGALTTPLIEKIKNITLIEKDKDLVPYLENQYNSNQVKVINQDILKCDLSNIIKSNMRIIGNLPYNISTEIIFKLLPYSKNIKDIHFMLQKEVVDRIVANPGTKIYGRLSIMTQVYFMVKKLFDISPNVFIPKPKVESGYIRLIPRNYAFKDILHEKKFKDLVTMVFTARRKMIKTSLRGIIHDDLLNKLSINPSARPETLTVQNYLDISKNV